MGENVSDTVSSLDMASSKSLCAPPVSHCFTYESMGGKKTAFHTAGEYISHVVLTVTAMPKTAVV